MDRGTQISAMAEVRREGAIVRDHSRVKGSEVTWPLVMHAVVRMNEVLPTSRGADETSVH